MAQSLRTLKGVGEKTEKLFQKVGIYDTDDLLHYYPRNYDEYETPVDIAELKEETVLDKIMVGITRLGDAGIIWIILTAIFLVIPKTRRTGGVMLAALVVQTILCNVILKNLFARTRPYDVNTTVQLLVPKLHDFSFPSGHTSASFTTVSALFFAKNKVWKPALVLACLIAVSRLYLYVHYPTDVLGGILLGILSGYIGYKIMEKLRNR